MAFTLSSNMSLPIPGVGTEAGPTYAIDINNALTLVDSHDHTPGKGVQITPAGININTALSMASNFLTGIAGLTLAAQSVTPAVNTIYENGVDLYFVDGLGNNVRITQSGGIAGSPGSISNLTSPASASYVAGSKTFVWQSGASLAANLDAASILLRNITPNSTNALTLSPPAALASNYTITLPTLPASTLAMTIDNSGNIATALLTGTQLSASANILGTQLSASANIAGTQLSASANILGSQLSASAGIVGTQLVNGTLTSANYSAASVGTTTLADGTVTPPKLAALNSTYSGVMSGVATSSYGNMGSGATIATSASRPIQFKFQNDPAGANVPALITASTACTVTLTLLRSGVTAIYTQTFTVPAGQSIPLGILDFVYTPGTSSSLTYSPEIKCSAGSVTWSGILLYAYEMA